MPHQYTDDRKNGPREGASDRVEAMQSLLGEVAGGSQRDGNPGSEPGSEAVEAAVGGRDTNCHCHGSERLHRDRRTGRFVTPDIEHVDTGASQRDGGAERPRLPDDDGHSGDDISVPGVFDDG